MKKSILVLAASLALTACMKEQQLEPLLNNEASKITTEKAMQTRPMKVNFYATPNTTQTVQCLPSPTIFVAGGHDIQGTATHLGLIDPASSFGTVLSCNFSQATFKLATHQTGQVAAANGDLMLFSSQEEISLVDGAITGVVTVTGGTGRFMNASGSINVQGTVNFQTGFAQWTGTGTVTY